MSFEGNNFNVKETTIPVEAHSESVDTLTDLQSKIEKLKEQAHAAQLNIYELPEYDALDAVVHKVAVLKARQEKLTWERDPKIREHLSKNLLEQIDHLASQAESNINLLTKIVAERRSGFEAAFGKDMAELRDAMDYDQKFKKPDPTPTSKKDGWWNESFRAEQAKPVTPEVVTESVSAVVLAEPKPLEAVAVHENVITPEARLEAIQQTYNRAKEAWLIARQAWESAKKMKNIPAGRVHDLEVQFDLAELAYIRAKREYEKEIGVAPEVETEPVKSKKGTRFNNYLKALLIGAAVATPTEQRAEQSVTQIPLVTEIGPSEPLFNTFGEQAPNQSTYGARRTQSFTPTVSPVEGYTGERDQTSYAKITNSVERNEVVQSVPVYQEVVGTPADGSEMRDPAVFDSNPIDGIQTTPPTTFVNQNFVTEYAPVFSSPSESIVSTTPEILEDVPVNLDSVPERVIVEVDGGGVETQYMPRALEVCKQYPRIPDRVADRLIHEIIAEYTRNPEMLRLRDVDRVSADDNRIDLTDVLSLLNERCQGVSAALQSGQEVIPETGSDMTKELNKYFAGELGTLENESDRASVVHSVIEELKHNPELLGRLADGLTDVNHISDLQLLRLGLLKETVDKLVSERVVDHVSESVQVVESQTDTVPQPVIEEQQQETPRIIDTDDDPVVSGNSEIAEEGVTAPEKLTIHTATIEEVEELRKDVRRVLQETAPDATSDEGNDKAVDAEPQNETSASDVEETEKITTTEEQYEKLLESIGVKEPGLIARITSSAEFTRYSDFEKLSKFTVGDLRDIALRTKPGPELREELRSYGISDVELFDSIIQLLLKNKYNLSNVMSVEKALQNIAVNNS